MHHCVYTYGDRCSAGEVSIYSMRVDDGSEEPENILTIAVDNKKRMVSQYRGKYNLLPSERVSKKKKKQTTGSYLHWLRESAHILRLWMDREGLAHETRE